MHIKTNKTALALALMSIAGGHTVTQAQPMLEEVIVTAQKRAESLMDVPISVSAVSGEKIRQMGIQRSEDLTAYAARTLAQGLARQGGAQRDRGPA